MPTITKLPILATIPRSGTWFLRYAVSFLIHLDRGGRIEDRLTGEVVGRPTGMDFDFRRFRGGPLFDTRQSMPHEHLFIGHTVCPGFAGSVDDHSWWARTPFHVPGYDYLHEGLNYTYTPIDLAVDVAYTPLSVRAVDRAAAAELGHSLDGTRAANISHMRSSRFEETLHDRLREDVVERLQWMGVDTGLLVWSGDNSRNHSLRQKGHVAAE